MSQDISFVGLDAHKDSINVALLLPKARQAEQWRVVNRAEKIRELVRTLRRRTAGPIKVCYEAGPTGFALQRQLSELGVSCVVIAPSLIPSKPGDRVKTDRRDAAKLAELLRAGILTEVEVPSTSDEAVRDVCRAREDAREDCTRARHRLQKFLLRRARLFDAGKKSWTIAHRRWLDDQHFDDPHDQFVFEDYLAEVKRTERRVEVLSGKLEEISQQPKFKARTDRLRCFRGIDTVTAMTFITELHGFERFRNPRQLMAYLGLVPSEYSSAGRRIQGSITKCGNSHVRRVLVEAAWNYRHKPAVGVGLRKRRAGQSPTAIEVADRAMDRLHRRFTAMVFKGKPYNKAVVAVARELAGFMWAALQGVDSN